MASNKSLSSPKSSTNFMILNKTVNLKSPNNPFQLANPSNSPNSKQLVLSNKNKIQQQQQLHQLKNLNSRKKIQLTHQFFTLSLLEYICNLLNINDKNAAEFQFQGKLHIKIVILNLLVFSLRKSLIKKKEKKKFKISCK